MVEHSNKYYLAAGSRCITLEDESGIAIYNGYSGDTLFLIKASSEKDRSTIPTQINSFDKTDLMVWLNLSAESAKQTIQRLVQQKVIWLK